MTNKAVHLVEKKKWKMLDGFNMGEVLSPDTQTELARIMAKRGTEENPGTEVNLAGRRRTEPEHWSDCIVGKCAEYDFSSKHKLSFISRDVMKKFPNHPKIGKMRENNFQYNDLIDLNTGLIFELKCWGEKWCRDYDKGAGWKSLYKAKTDGWLLADFFVIYGKNYIKNKGATKIRLDGVYSV